jgi:myo-inositol-1(or 4)-monophosphatase
MLNDLLELARTAGRIAKEHAGVERDVASKGRGDWVSHVDRLIEDTLRSRIRARHPLHQILGEEGGGTIEAHRPLWIIDPIDGTTNYLRGIPAWAVSIALCEPRPAGFEPRYAVVYDPVRDEAFTAEAGAGAWLNGRRIYVSGCDRIEDALLASALPFRFPEHLDACSGVFLDLTRRSEDHRRGGAASLDLAYVAAGRLDGYYELGIYPWDTAAGELLVRAAGGLATDYAGSTANLPARRSIVAAATPALHSTLLQAVAPLVPRATALPGPITG